MNKASEQVVPVGDVAHFWTSVTKTDNCWLWGGPRHARGYGTFKLNDGRWVSAHRFIYEAHFGAIPAGLQIDHTCHNRDKTCPGGDDCRHRRCVNPAHLEAVTPGENTRRGKSAFGVNARKTHCPHGHPYDEANTIINRRGSRVCRTCQKAKKHPGMSTAARTHCPQGHPYSDENTYRTPQGHRKCRTCMQAARRLRTARAAEARALAAKEQPPTPASP